VKKERNLKPLRRKIQTQASIQTGEKTKRPERPVRKIEGKRYSPSWPPALS